MPRQTSTYQTPSFLFRSLLPRGVLILAFRGSILDRLTGFLGTSWALYSRPNSRFIVYGSSLEYQYIDIYTVLHIRVLHIWRIDLTGEIFGIYLAYQAFMRQRNLEKPRWPMRVALTIFCKLRARLFIGIG